jgi:hypothetical protein
MAKLKKAGCILHAFLFLCSWFCKIVCFSSLAVLKSFNWTDVRMFISIVELDLAFLFPFVVTIYITKIQAFFFCFFMNNGTASFTLRIVQAKYFLPSCWMHYCAHECPSSLTLRLTMNNGVKSF